MLAACRNAQTSIDLEQYIFVNDRIGFQFIEVLIKKAREGVRVRVILDMVGSIALYVSGLDQYVREKGVEIVYFNPISLWRLGHIASHFFRDHRKILIVDESVGFIGGVGIEDRMKTWRDTMVEVHGALVPSMVYTFELTWKRLLYGRYRRFIRPHHTPADYEISINAPRYRQRLLYHLYIARIRAARTSIYIAAPYFVPDRRFFRALRAAARRGVKVTLVIPRIHDHYINDYVRAWYVTHALKAGITIFFYDQSFYHVKMATIDGQWATIGSCNIDNMSFVFNHEANIVSTNAHFIAEVEKHFEKDIEISQRVKYDEWNNRSWFLKVVEVMTWPFHMFF